MLSVRNLFLIPFFILALSLSLGGVRASSKFNLEVRSGSLISTPENVVVDVLSNNYAQLSWSVNSSDILGYYIYRNGKRLTSVREPFYLDQNLSPDTLYHYQVSVYDSHGNESDLTSPISIETPPPQVVGDKESLENSISDDFIFLPTGEKISTVSPFLGDYGRPDDVTDLTLGLQNKGVFVSWRNPSDFDNVYIVRSLQFYPASRFAGLPLWQGEVTNYLDVDIEYNKNYYYGVFVCRDKNICSPGAYVVARLNQAGDSLLTSTTTISLAQRLCDKKILTTNKDFFISFANHLRPHEIRLHLLRLFKDGKILSSYKMVDDTRGNFLTSDLVLTEPGIYYYEVESYDIHGADPKSLSCGELTVVEKESEEKSQDWIALIFSFFSNIF